MKKRSLLAHVIFIGCWSLIPTIAAQASCLEKFEKKYHRWMDRQNPRTVSIGQGTGIGLLAAGIGAGPFVALASPIGIGAGIGILGGTYIYVKTKNEKLSDIAVLYDVFAGSSIFFKKHSNGTCEITVPPLSDMGAEAYICYFWQDLVNYGESFIRSVQESNPALSREEVLRRFHALDEEESFCPGKRIYSARKIARIIAE